MSDPTKPLSTQWNVLDQAYEHIRTKAARVQAIGALMQNCTRGADLPEDCVRSIGDMLWSAGGSLLAEAKNIDAARDAIRVVAVERGELAP